MRRLALLTLVLLFAPALRAQHAAAHADSALLAVRVVHKAAPVAVAMVRAGRAARQTDAEGVARFRLEPGAHRVIASRIGFAPETTHVTLRPGADTLIVVHLREPITELERVVVTSARSERRLEDVPLRIEVIDREEIEEKMLMTPGDIAMLLNETAGLRVQTTSPSLGGATVRMQGLRGRYTQVLSDGLPLHGGQTGALGLLQIPPMDLGQVEVIKGAASALYGAQALGGVINLVSRRPDPEGERELLLNQTSRGGSDAVLWLSGVPAGAWGYTLLAGAHYQERRDLDGDGWTDIAGYRRAVVRPRITWEPSAGNVILFTTGATIESRAGGTLAGRTTPGGTAHRESLDTRRFDLGTNASFTLPDGPLLAVRASATHQSHEHGFGAVQEDDRHRTLFGEVTLAVPRGMATWIGGVAWQQEEYRADQLPQFDFVHSTPAVFVQADLDPYWWLALSASARADAHNVYGTFVHPRLSTLLRAPAGGALDGWTLRASVATGAFAPTPFTEETEVTGLSVLLPPGDLRAERALALSLDVNGDALGLELNGTLFHSIVRSPVMTIPDVGDPARLRLINAAHPTRTAGTELLARWRAEPLALIATYTFTHSTEWEPASGRRRAAPLVPRHAAGIVGMWEEEDEGRVGVELYYTGVQALADNPFRAHSRPYVVFGMLVERRFGSARLFVNGENLGNVRQTRFDPLLRPTPGPGGRWTTDAWTELSGRTINGGVRWEF